MNLTTTRALVRTLPLDTSTRGEWLAWCVAVDRGYVPAERAAAELEDWQTRLGLPDGSVVAGDYRSPGEVLAAVRQVGLEAEQTQQDVTRYLQGGGFLPGTLPARWGAWYRRFRAWYDETEGSTWASLWGSTWDELEGWQRELVAYREELARAAVRLQTTTTSIDRPRSNPITGAAAQLGMFALGAAALGGVLYLLSSSSSRRTSSRRG